MDALSCKLILQFEKIYVVYQYLAHIQYLAHFSPTIRDNGRRVEDMIEVIEAPAAPQAKRLEVSSHLKERIVATKVKALTAIRHTRRQYHLRIRRSRRSPIWLSLC